MPAGTAPAEFDLSIEPDEEPNEKDAYGHTRSERVRFEMQAYEGRFWIVNCRFDV
jgi:hypothetical protein